MTQISNNLALIFMFTGLCIVNQCSIIIQQDATIHSFIIFLQTAVHVLDDTLIHHQEHTQP